MMNGTHHQQAQAIGSSATRQLADLQRSHGLNETVLRALSSNLEVVGDLGVGLPLLRFRQEVAEPRCEVLVAESGLALAEAGNRMAVLLGDMAHRSTQQDRKAVVNSFDGALHIPRPIRPLGERWYRRLRRRTVRRLVRDWATTSAAPFSDRYRTAQLATLDSAPWSYQDRLLTVFEGADRELVDLRRDLICQLLDTAESVEISTRHVVELAGWSAR